MKRCSFFTARLHTWTKQTDASDHDAPSRRHTSYADDNDDDDVADDSFCAIADDAEKHTGTHKEWGQ